MAQREIYNGVFISPDTIDKIRDILAENGVETREREQPITEPHITFEYRGAESMREYFGEQAEIRIVGYASEAPSDSKYSGGVEAVAVEVRFPNNPELQEKFEQKEISRNDGDGRESGFRLHITMSLDTDTKAVEGGYVDFREVEPIVVEGGIMGGYMGDGQVDIGPDSEYADMENDVRNEGDPIDGTEIPEEPSDGPPDGDFPDDESFDGPPDC